jgi:beta-lactamase superfamily II metal-dependent hydrolase
LSATSQASETKPNPAQSTSEKEAPQLEINILHCGQGDTILLRLFSGKWALIDCNLPRGSARIEFFKLTSGLNIKRLDLVCLTHPHDDHYTGMEEVLRHFNSEGRSVRFFCDCGTEPREVHTLLRRRNRPTSSVREYERLYRYVAELIDSGRVTYFCADENSVPIIDSEQLQLMPIGPRPDVARRAVQTTISSGKIRDDLNRLSIVLVLMARLPKGNFDTLLTADTGADGFRSAMERLQTRIGIETQPTFDVVKVAHHGSLDSHAGSNVCEHKKLDKAAVAAISTGSFEVLPDREVLTEFIGHDWTVLLTTKRVSKRRQYGLELSGNPVDDKITVETQNITLKWSEDEGLLWSPASARVFAHELSNYQTAAE